MRSPKVLTLSLSYTALAFVWWGLFGRRSFRLGFRFSVSVLLEPARVCSYRFGRLISRVPYPSSKFPISSRWNSEHNGCLRASRFRFTLQFRRSRSFRALFTVYLGVTTNRELLKTSPPIWSVPQTQLPKIYPHYKYIYLKEEIRNQKVGSPTDIISLDGLCVSFNWFQGLPNGKSKLKLSRFPFRGLKVLQIITRRRSPRAPQLNLNRNRFCGRRVTSGKKRDSA